jgi:hypothetical protein
MYSLALMIFVVSEKKAFEHFPVGSNVNLCGPYEKNVSKRFFSETTWTIETKLPRNDHWKVLYKVYVFYVDRKSKMAATAIHRLTLDPMGKMFQNASSLKPHGQLKPNCPGMIIGRSSTTFMFFMSIRNPRWPPPQFID